VGDVDALAGVLGRLVRDGEMRARAGARSRELVGSWGFREDVQGIVECLARVVG
jgi:hypothetical protein